MVRVGDDLTNVIAWLSLWRRVIYYSWRVWLSTLLDKRRGIMSTWYRRLRMLGSSSSPRIYLGQTVQFNVHSDRYAGRMCESWFGEQVTEQGRTSDAVHDSYELPRCYGSASKARPCSLAVRFVWRSPGSSC